MCQYIAAKYHLPFEVVSLHEEYWESVMQYALRTVKEGLTPNPDIMCNRMIKFGYFNERWGKDYDKVATGHYATTIIGDDGLTYLGTAPDPVKDQTDFLARITYEQLAHAMFPIGDIPKSRVRELAIEAALPNAYRRDSQGICFLGKINYNDFIRRHLGEKPGAIVELETGRKLGQHRGYWFHTIGQRKGLGLSGGPWYVVKKNVHDNVTRCTGLPATRK
jgi:tRNA-specific 2-thiouridylase